MHDKLKAALKVAYQLAGKLPPWPQRAYIRQQIEEAQDALDEYSRRGPEADREEVGFARSPQRDCMAARVTPALSF